MKNHSQVYIDFENNISNLRRLSYGMRYIVDKKEQFIKWLREEKGEKFPEEVFRQELENTAKMELEVSNILLRTYIERFGYNKCGDFRIFLRQYKAEIQSHKIKYQRDLPPMPVLDINRDLRDYSIHSKPKYTHMKTSKTSFQILSEDVVRLTNRLGKKEIVLLHDLNNETIKNLLDQAYKIGNQPLASWMLFGELLRDEVLECIRQIDLS